LYFFGCFCADMILSTSFLVFVTFAWNRVWLVFCRNIVGVVDVFFVFFFALRRVSIVAVFFVFLVWLWFILSFFGVFFFLFLFVFLLGALVLSFRCFF